MTSTRHVRAPQPPPYPPPRTRTETLQHRQAVVASSIDDQEVVQSVSERRPSVLSVKTMNSSPGRSRRRNSRVIGLALVLLVIAAAPRDVSSFSTGSFASRICSVSHSPCSRVATGTVDTSRGRTLLTKLNAGLNAAYVGSLDDIASNPHLFPTTSDYLSRLEDRQASASPSAEEFLTQLSAEFQSLRAIPTNIDDEEVAIQEEIERSSPFSNQLEAFAPVFASAVGVGAAAETYNPASYANVLVSNNPIMAMANNEVGSGAGITESLEAESVSESFAAWHSGGGSNALRDLASTIPIEEMQQQQDVGYAAAPEAASYAQETVQYASDAYYAPATSGAEFGTTWHSQGGSSALQNLAAAIPTDVVELPEPLQVDVGSADDLLGKLNAAMDPAAATASLDSAIPTEATVAAAASVSDQATPAEAAVAAATSTVDQASAVPELNGELANSLSSQLSDLNYGETATAKAPVIGDYFKAKLESLHLPQYHIELPKVTLPELEPSSGMSKEKLDGLLSTLSHTFDGLGDKVADASNSMESLSRQVNKAAESGVSGAKAFGSAVQSGASTVGDGLSGVRSSIKGVGEGVAGAASSAKSVLPGVDLATPSNVKMAAPDLPNVNLPKPALPTLDIHGPTLPSVNLPHPTMPNLGEVSLAGFGNAVLHAIAFTGGLVIKFIDLILNAAAGTSVSAILTGVQTSVSTAIDNASHAVTSTITNIGNLSVREIIQHSMALVLAISDVLLKIVNAIIYIISGKDGADWALQASSSVNGAGSQLLAHATSTYDDVTHASVTQLAHSIGDYSQHVGDEFVTLIGSLNGVIGSAGSLDGVAIPEDALDGVATAVQTALSL